MHLQSPSPFLKNRCNSQVCSNASIVFISLLCLNMIRDSWKLSDSWIKEFRHYSYPQVFRPALGMQVPYPFWCLHSETRGLHNKRTLRLRLLLVLHASVVTRTNSKLFLYLQQYGSSTYGIGFSRVQSSLCLSRIPSHPKIFLFQRWCNCLCVSWTHSIVLCQYRCNRF